MSTRMPLASWSGILVSKLCIQSPLSLRKQMTGWMTNGSGRTVDDERESKQRQIRQPDR